MAKKDAKWTDDTLMPWGKHKDTRLADIDAEWLVWLSRQDWIKKFHGLKLYLDDCKAVLEAEIEEHRDEQTGEGSTSYDDYLKNWKS